MKPRHALLLLASALLGLAGIGYATVPASSYDIETAQRRINVPPAVPQFIYAEIQAKQNAPLEVAMVFGRSDGCRNASPELIRQVADSAIHAHLSPKKWAALIATESGCNPLAISSKGAVGLSQVVPKVWASKYDIAGRINLLNSNDNLRVGSQILADYIWAYGETEGIHRYNGTGIGCETCDSQYNYKIEQLAAAR